MHRSLNIAIIGNGAIARYVAAQLNKDEHIRLCAVITRGAPHEVARLAEFEGSEIVASVDELPAMVELLVDCAGHPGLRAHGPDALLRGLDVVSISTGALADSEFAERLAQAAINGGATLKLLAGAIGGIDVLGAGSVGKLHEVRYTGSKPPLGWKGSPAEEVCDLDALKDQHIHFDGTAREAALAYPKNANVAATVALSGIGMDATEVKLIADPAATQNRHEVLAKGSFGELKLTINANSLPDNPRSSALAAMSIVQEIRRRTKPIQF